MVSAIITTHNRKVLLRRAIESVLKQTYTDIECIVVDDASTDGTSEVCTMYPVQYIHIPKEESHGGNYARNLGIKAAKGEYIAFLDDDDYWLPEKTEKQLRLIRDKKCRLVYCGIKIEAITKEGTNYIDVKPNPLFQGELQNKILQTICCCTSSTMMVSKEILFDVGLFDEALLFWQDYELTIRLAQKTSFYYVNESLCVYRKDILDSNRLTNKYFGWKKSVNYIHHKHKKLYDRLTFKERCYAKVLVWEDAAKRCKTAELKWRYYYYNSLKKFLWYAPKRIIEFFKVKN